MDRCPYCGRFLKAITSGVYCECGYSQTWSELADEEARKLAEEGLSGCHPGEIAEEVKETLKKMESR